MPGLLRLLPRGGMQGIEGLAVTFQRLELSVSVDGGRGSWELDRSCSNGRMRLSWLEGFQGFSKARHQSIATDRINRRSRKRVGSKGGGLDGLVHTVSLWLPQRTCVTELHGQRPLLEGVQEFGQHGVREREFDRSLQPDAG